VGQLLAAITMNASQIEREKAKLGPAAARCLEENARLVEQASTEIRTVSYLLHPPMLDEVGLESALRWYLDGFADRSKIRVALEVTPNFGQLPPDCELCLFRIAQECLTNVHRHSGSPVAAVRLSRTHGEIEMEVRDEGRGLSREIQAKIASGASAGVGFRGMQERASQLRGTLKIRSDGNGTSIVVVLPVLQELSPDQSEITIPQFRITTGTADPMPHVSKS
jgi:two-component system NarL family sensor kinase